MEQVLVTFYEVEMRRRNQAASRVQGLARMKNARDSARRHIFSQFEKRFDVYSGKFYYHSNKTGVDTFAKPRLLRADQVGDETVPSRTCCLAERRSSSSLLKR